MMSWLKNVKWFSLLTGILLILLGIWCLVAPVHNLVNIGILLVISLLLAGVSELVRYFLLPSEERSGLSLLNGVVTLVLAIWLLTSNSLADYALYLPSMMAFWLLFTGISRMAAGFVLMNPILPTAGLVWSGALAALAGLVLLYHPFLAGSFIIYLVAFGLLYEGCFQLAIFWQLRQMD